MCLSSGLAKFSGTTLYAGVAQRHDANLDSNLVHVIGYQNVAFNLSDSPNCMMLPFQAHTAMTQRNVVDMTSNKHALTDMRTALFPPVVMRRPPSNRPESSNDDPVHVFQHDIYTIVLGRVGADLLSGLRQVPVDQRPAISDEIITFWKTYYPGYHLALCCFNNTKAKEAAPMVWWYEPVHAQTIVAPAIDGHDGKAPTPGAPVHVDHTLITAWNGMKAGTTVQYREAINGELLELLPKVVTGAKYTKTLPNGDFLIDIARLQQGAPIKEAVSRGILRVAA